MKHRFTDPEEAKAWETVRTLARECLEASRKERPELIWLNQIYEKKRLEYGYSKSQMDALIYERMHGKPPAADSSMLKIRYWRTGHHIPINRETCLAFGRALELSAEENDYLLTAWLDKSKDCYKEAPPDDDPVYRERRGRLEELTKDYLAYMQTKTFPSSPPLESALSLESSGTKSFKSYLRHLYYVDAMQYVLPDSPSPFWEKHIYSIRYDMEFKRNLMLLGEIPRKTMLRHLILFGMPHLTTDWLNEQLIFFGYLPLTADHSLTGGEHLDKLLIGMIKCYEELRQKNGFESAHTWFLSCYRRLDAFYTKNKLSGFRFMFFKSLE